jgi:hypothetical protein
MMRTMILVALLTLGACNGSEENLQRTTAMQIGSNVSPARVTVTNVEHHWLQGDVMWNATYGGRAYSCSADLNVLSPHCVRDR